MNFKTLLIKKTYFILFCLCIFSISGCSTIKGWFSFQNDSKSENIIAQVDSNAIDKFAADIQYTQKNGDEQYKLARHFQKLNKHEIAIEEFIKVLKIDPLCYNAYNAIGVSYDNLKQHDDAIDAYNAALKINPNLSYVHNNIGYSNLLKGDLKAATIAFEKAISIEPKDVYQNNLALANAKSGKTESLIAKIPPLEEKAQKLPVQDEKSALKLAPIIDFDEKITSPKVELVSHEPTQKDIQSTNNSTTYFGVQLGVYYDVKDALKILMSAKEKGYDCPYITKIDKAKPYYRVRFGKYDSQVKAESIASAIIDKHGKTPLIITENYPVDVFHADIDKNCDNPPVKYQVALNKVPNIEILNGNGIHHMASRVSKFFEYKGFEVEAPSNAKHFNFKTTKIYYSPGNYSDALKLAQYIPGLKSTCEFVKSTKIKTRIQVVIGKDIVFFNKNLKRNLHI